MTTHPARFAPRAPRWLVGLLSILALTGSGPALASADPIIDSFSATKTVVAPGETITITVNAHDPDCPSVCDDTAGCGEYIREDLTGWSATGGSFTRIDKGVDGSPYTSDADWQAPTEEGTYTISVYVADSGTFVCGGRGSTEPSMDIQVAAAPNDPPVIGSLTADPSAIYLGETSTVTCVASDPNGDPVTYSWDADHGSIVDGGGGTATFTAEQAGTATITCTAKDDKDAPTQDTVGIAIEGAGAEKEIRQDVARPQRMAVDSMGDVYVVDPGNGGLTVVNLFSGALVYRIAMPGVRSVDVDWADRLLVADRDTARLTDRAGQTILMLTPSEPLGDIVDVAADGANQRYGVLHRRAGRVVVYDQNGVEVLGFGSTGDGVDQVKSPHGLATMPDGRWVVADSSHGLIKIYSSAGVYESSIGGLGGNVGEFVSLLDVETDDRGVIYASDSYQSRVQAFNPDGSMRESLGSHGNATGQFVTPTGVAAIPGFDRVVAGSLNGSALQVFTTSKEPVASGPAPVATLDPASLDFGNVGFGQDATLPTTLRNDGNAPLGVLGASTRGDFSQTNDCPSFLDPAASCTFQVTFRPTVLGPLAGALEVRTSADSALVEAALTGYGFQAPAATLAPDSMLFGAQVIGTSGDPQVATLTNQGPVELTVGSIMVTGEYTFSHDCPALLGVGASCDITVWFAPVVVADPSEGRLTVATNASNAPHVTALSGSAVYPTVLASIADAGTDEGDEGTRDLLFDVTLAPAPDGPVEIDYATVADTATTGEDFQAVSGTVSFGPGETSASIVVPVIGDLVLEPEEETFQVELTATIGATVEDGTAVGTIHDDEACLGPNLLANPGAETQPRRPEIPGWVQVEGNDWLPAMGPPWPPEGTHYFFAGITPYAVIEQMVDVRPYTDLIVGGKQKFEFEGYVRSREEPPLNAPDRDTPTSTGSGSGPLVNLGPAGGTSSSGTNEVPQPPDTARVVLEYLHRDSGAVLETWDTGEIASPDKWTRVHDRRFAPVDTGWIRVRLISKKYSGFENDGWFDDLSLRSLRAPAIVVDDPWDYEGNAGSSHDVPFTVDLACPYHRDVTFHHATADGSATAGEDYDATSGDVTILSGDVTATIPVTVHGDDIDEDHETYTLTLSSLAPADVIPVRPTGTGTIRNDDFCPQTPAYWDGHPWLWPVTYLELGSKGYDQDELRWFLTYAGTDVSNEVARELAAAKLNLEEGSAPDIVPTVEEADRFLRNFEPGSNPEGTAGEETGPELRDALAAYNTRVCGGGAP